jgi:hypothetical protein
LSQINELEARKTKVVEAKKSIDQQIEELMTTPLTKLQEEEEDRKNRIYKSLKKKK